MNSMYKVVVVAGAGIIVSCQARVPAKNGSGTTSNMKSVTINQPDLKKEMIGTLSDDDKKKIMDSLVYSIAINPVQKDSKDDCDAGVAATKFESGVLTLDKSTIDSIKVKRGCNYLVSMNVGAKSDDGKSIKTLYIASWDAKQPSILSKEELEKAKPTAVVKLFVTAEGKRYWNADEIVTPGDTDTTIDPSLSKSFELSATLPEIKRAEVAPKFKGGFKIKPIAASSKDIFCGVSLNIWDNSKPFMDETGLHVVPAVNNLLYLENSLTKSIVKIKAGDLSEIDLSAKFVSETDRLDFTYLSAIALCADTEALALAKLSKCLDQPVKDAVSKKLDLDVSSLLQGSCASSIKK